VKFVDEEEDDDDDWFVSIGAHFVTCCGEMLINFHGNDKMHDTITYRTNKISRNLSKITLHYINTNEHQQ